MLFVKLQQLGLVESSRFASLRMIFCVVFPLADQVFDMAVRVQPCLLSPTSATNTTGHNSTVAFLHAARDNVTGTDRKASYVSAKVVAWPP